MPEPDPQNSAANPNWKYRAWVWTIRSAGDKAAAILTLILLTEWNHVAEGGRSKERHRPAIAQQHQIKKAGKLERVAGIEPAYSAWKAAALPLSYTRGGDFDPCRMVEGVGFEPT